MDGRPYLHFHDYRRWRGWLVKGDLRRLVKPGFLRASWNQWVEGHGGDMVAAVADVAVYHFTSWAENAPVEECLPDEAAAKLAVRHKLLSSLRAWAVSDFDGADLWGQTLPYRRASFVDEVKGWHEDPREYALEVAPLRQAASLIGGRYFGGKEALYRGSAQILADCQHMIGVVKDLFHVGLVQEWERVGRLLAEEPEISNNSVSEVLGRLGLGGVPAEGHDAAAHLAGYLVNIAKAEALELLGEREAAENILVRHWRP